MAKSWMRRLLGTMCVVTALGMAGPAPAGDRSGCDVLGFSPDGRVFAFEQSGHQDGSGFPYADLFFVDVVRNSWVQSPLRLVDTADDGSPDGLERLRCELLRSARPSLRRLGLVHPVQGEPRIENFEPASAQDLKRVTFTMDAGEYSLTVTERDVQGAESFDDGPAQLLELTLEGPGMTPVVLQRDERLPLSRRGARNYEICYVGTLHERGALVVILSYQTPGFEGPDTRFMAVTASIAF